MSELRPHVILIEDEATIRRFVRLALEAEGCEVFEATGLQRGLIEAGTRRPDLVVLDLGLPDGDGIDEIDAVAIGEAEIEHHQVGAEGTGLDQPALQAGRLEYLAALGLERQADEAADGGFVLDEDDVGAEFAHEVMLT